MLFQQIAVFVIYVAWFAGPFFVIELVKERKASREDYVKGVLVGGIVIVALSATLAFVMGDLAISLWLVATMNWVAYLSAKRLNDLGIPKVRALWILTGIGLAGVPLYCIFASRRLER